LRALRIGGSRPFT
ncbi:unnamed protein product, partial [Caretta caretta]